MAFCMTGLYPSLSIYTTPFPAPASGSLEGQGKDCPSIQVMSGGLRAKKNCHPHGFLQRSSGRVKVCRNRPKVLCALLYVPLGVFITSLEDQP